MKGPVMLYLWAFKAFSDALKKPPELLKIWRQQPPLFAQFAKLQQPTKRLVYFLDRA